MNTNAPEESTIPTVNTTIANVVKAVHNGVAEGTELAAQTAAEAPAKAAAIINELPAQIEAATKEHVRLHLGGYVRLKLLPLSFEDTTELYPKARDVLILNPTRLRNAARLVYDHCDKAGLNPHLIGEGDDSGKNQGYSLYISWTLPPKPESTPKAQPRRWYLLWLA